MNKSHLINHVADELRTSKLQAALLVETVLDGIKKGLENGPERHPHGIRNFPAEGAQGARGALSPQR
jgi:nucleoid DNA-binding protein